MGVGTHEGCNLKRYFLELSCVRLNANLPTMFTCLSLGGRFQPHVHVCLCLGGENLF